MELVITVVTAATVRRQQIETNVLPTPVRIIVAYACAICSGLDLTVRRLWAIVMLNVMAVTVPRLRTATIV